MSKAILKGNASGTGSVTLESPNTNSDRTISLPDADGTVVVSGTTPTLNGITFPATQVPSADANTLDDYEEGSFTATYTGSGGSPSITSQNCQYVKVGKLVTVNMEMQINLGGTTYSWGSIGGLPFTCSSVNYVTGSSREWYSTGKMTECILSSGGTSIGLLFYDNTSSLSGITIVGIGTTISYITA